MKKTKLIAITAVITVFVLAACDKSEVHSDEMIAGTYLGTLTNYGSLKSGTMKTEDNATVDITKIGDKLIEVHCYGAALDTLFMLNYYQHIDSVGVCLTGDDFESMYGHMLGQGHMGGGMMNDMLNDETEWMHHLDDEHEEGDEHFGGFDTQELTFGYRFDMMEEGTAYHLQFQGKKQ